MTGSEKFYKLLRDLSHEITDPDALADALIAKMTMRDLRDWVRPLVKRECQAQIARAKSGTFTPITSRSDQSASARMRSLGRDWERKLYNALSVASGNAQVQAAIMGLPMEAMIEIERDWVPIGRVTVEQWRRKVEQHLAQMNGHQQTIMRYQKFVSLVESAGCSTLYEVAYGEEAAA